MAHNVAQYDRWFVRPPGGAPYGPVHRDAIIEGIRRGQIAGGSYFCPLGDNTWLPAASVPMFRKIIDGASISTLRPVEISIEDETPTPVRAPPRPMASPPTGRAPSLPPLPSIPRRSPVESDASPQRPSFWVAALVSALFGGGLGATAWLIHDGSRELPAPSLVGAPPAPVASTSSPPTAAAAATGSIPTRLAELLGGVREHPICRDPAGRDNGLCGWIVAVASDTPAPTVTLPELQKALAQKGIFQAELTVLAEPDEAGRIPVRLYGDYGYCFEPKRVLSREARVIAWVQRRGQIRTAVRRCVVLEEEPAIATLVELTRSQGTERAPALAKEAVTLLTVNR